MTLEFIDCKYPFLSTVICCLICLLKDTNIAALRHVGGDADGGDGAIGHGVREILAEQRAGCANGQRVDGQEVRAGVPRGGRRELRLRDHLRVHQHLLHVLWRQPGGLHMEVLVRA